MSTARAGTLAKLQGMIGGLESPADGLSRVALGHVGADIVLQGGLIRGAMHEVFAEAGRHAASATGFIAGLAHRMSKSRPLVWVQQDFTKTEAGALSMSGFAELGLDPRAVVMISAADSETAIRVAADAIACDALGAVVLDVWGEVRTLDLVASRKLTLAARTSNVTALLLRTAAAPSPSTAETRWIVRSAHSPPNIKTLEERGWGAPMLDIQLVRNRHGPTGRWIMEWNCDESLFRESQTHSQPLAAAFADRQIEASIVMQHRRAG